MIPAALIAAVLLSSPADATQRSRSAVAEFKRANPCPVNGQARGPCPGWEVDHIEPLKCGGADRPGNMQWLTVAEHRVKTRYEVRWCRH